MRGAAWCVAAGLTLAAIATAADPPAAIRSGRVLYSNDATNLLNASAFDRADPGASVVARLHRSIDEAAAAGTHLLQPGNGWVPWWHSRLYPADEHYRWYRRNIGLPLDGLSQFMLEGGDLVAEFVVHCRRRGLSPIVSLRMNDYHGAETHDLLLDALRGRPPPAEARFSPGEAATQSRFLLEHPEYRLKPDPADYTRADTAERLRYIAEPARRIRLRTARVLNWAIPEVRALKLGFIRELAGQYDLDGLELDFMRWSALFRLDETALEERIAIMVGFIRETRAILDRTAPPGKKRRLGVRVPLRLSGHAPLGLDLPRWVAAGVDFFNLSCHYLTEQQSDLAAIHQQVSATPLFLELTFANANAVAVVEPGAGGGYRPTTEQQLLTAAHLAYARGAHGVSLFNFAYYRSHAIPRGEPPFAVLGQLSDPPTLARAPQHYFLSQSSNPPSGPSQFAQQRAVSSRRAARWVIDLAPPVGGWRHDGRLRLQAAAPFRERNLQVSLNGRRLAESVDLAEPFATRFAHPANHKHCRAWTVPAAALRPGANEVTLAVPDEPALEFVFVDLSLP